MIRKFSIALLAAVTMLLASSQANAQFPEGNAPNPLFSQYVTQGAGTPSAGMYPAPHYSPMLGAQAYYTYQPLMPHEMMYQHSRNYYNYYNTGGYYGGNNAVTKTSVRWQAGNLHMGPLPFSSCLGNLGYRVNARRYCLDGGCNTGGCLGHGRCASGNCGGTGACATGDCGGVSVDNATPPSGQ